MEISDRVAGMWQPDGDVDWCLGPHWRGAVGPGLSLQRSAGSTIVGMAFALRGMLSILLDSCLRVSYNRTRAVRSTGAGWYLTLVHLDEGVNSSRAAARWLYCPSLPSPPPPRLCRFQFSHDRSEFTFSLRLDLLSR